MTGPASLGGWLAVITVATYADESHHPKWKAANSGFYVMAGWVGRKIETWSPLGNL